jgi:hypothetical protein
MFVPAKLARSAGSPLGRFAASYLARCAGSDILASGDSCIRDVIFYACVHKFKKFKKKSYIF